MNAESVDWKIDASAEYSECEENGDSIIFGTYMHVIYSTLILL